MSDLTFFKNPSNSVAVSWDGKQIVLPTGRVLLASTVPVWQEVEDEDLTDLLSEVQMETLLVEVEKQQAREACVSRFREEDRRRAIAQARRAKIEDARAFNRTLRAFVRMLAGV
jgi:hypothetical protein